MMQTTLITSRLYHAGGTALLRRSRGEDPNSVPPVKSYGQFSLSRSSLWRLSRAVCGTSRAKELPDHGAHLPLQCCPLPTLVPVMIRSTFPTDRLRKSSTI